MLKFVIQHYQELSSTNQVLKEMCQKQEAREGTVILADYQTAGRGTSGNTWQADAGKNLLCSILFAPMLDVEHHFSIVQFISLAITETLQEYGVQAKIKWPNDIYVDNHKIAGILIENTLMGSQIQNAIVGIGLNVNQQSYGDLPNPISLWQLLQQDTNINQLLGSLLQACAHRYELLQVGSFIHLHKEYLDKLFKLGEHIQYLKGPATLEGTLKGVSETGELEVIDAKGTLHKYLFGEIKIVVSSSE